MLRLHRNAGPERNPYDFTPDTQQLIELLNQRRFYAVPELEPLWSQAVILSAEIHNKLRQRRADNTQFIWDRYKRLERMFLDTVRTMQEHGNESRLKALKPVIKRILGVDTQWLVFHCPTEDGGTIHVMV